MTAAMRFADGGAVRAVLEGEKRVLEVLAIPFGGPDRRDRLNQWFSARTDIMLDIGDSRPALYMHGLSPGRRQMTRPPLIGMATFVRVDEMGGWMRTELNDTELATRSWEAAKAGRAAASTGSVNYLVRPQPRDDGKYPPGEVEVWPVAELSIFDTSDGQPVSDDAVVLPLRAIFDELKIPLPEALEAGEAMGAVETSANRYQEEPIMSDEPTIEPVPEPTPEPVPAPVAEAPPAPPARRSVFNIKKETVGEPADNAKKESWEWFWHMRHGIVKGPAFRVLEESEAAEGLPMVPQDALNAIVAMRNETSVAARAGLTRYTTDKLIFNIPRESTAMTRLAAIAEEGAYVANEPAFALLPITVVKYGSMITATEEFLEDQNLFIPWFTEACGRAWALAENAELYTTLDVVGNGTVGVAGSDTLTLAEFNTFFWFMTTPYRDNTVLIMNPGTMAVLQALLVATPYAFGGYPDVARNPLGLPSINGVPCHLVSDWIIYTGAAALGLVLSHLNPAYAGIVERRGMTIKVDPYGDSLNGRIRYFPSVRFAPFVSQPLAHVVKNGI